MERFLRKFLWVFAAFWGILFVNTCKDPFSDTVGLGAYVPTLAPVIGTESKDPEAKAPGAILYGDKNEIYIYAESEGTIATVTMTIWYGDPEQEITVPAVWDNEKGCYVANIDTLNLPDGPIRTQITAVDNAGRPTTTTDITYTVKNGPPQITMLLPSTDTNAVNELLNESPYPKILTDTSLMGSFKDLAGLQPGYPLIKLWNYEDPEPVDYRQNSGWGNVTQYIPVTDGGWVSADVGIKGGIGGGFEYTLRDRKPDGSPKEEKQGLGLTPDKLYKLKVKAVDINGIALEWPRDSFPNKPDYMTMEIYANGMKPVIEIIEPVKQYLKDNFRIKAWARHEGQDSIDIIKMSFSVTGDNSKSVLLAEWTGTQIHDFMEKEFLVEVDSTYYCMFEGNTAVKGPAPGGAHSFVTFKDGSYNFIITATDNIGSTKDEQKTIYVHKTPPANVINVFHYYSKDSSKEPSGEIPYDQYTVNKTIKIDVSSTDNYGNSVDEDTKHVKFKYLFLNDSDDTGIINKYKNSTAEEFGEYLYDRAEFLGKDAEDETVAPVFGDNNYLQIRGSKSLYSLWLRTHKFRYPAPTPDKYNLWMYIIVMNNAGSTTYNKILLNVDQDTDKPRIEWGNINLDGSTFMDDKYFIRLTVTDDKGMSNTAGTEAPVIEYRFAKNTADKTNPSNWRSIPATSVLSEDVLSVSISDLSLIKIAGNLTGTPSENLTDGHKTALGSETEPKFIQIRAVDNVNKKVLASDGIAAAESEWRQFTMDLTYPEILISKSNLNGGALTGRDAKNPFGIPEKERAYRELNETYGDIIEDNLKSITVKIDGDNTKTTTYSIVSSVTDHAKSSIIYPAKPSTLNPANFYIWKDGGALRWYIPMAGFYSGLEDGSHTFEISFEDKVPQVTTTSLSFYKDTKGPVISLINPGEKVIITNSERATIKTALENNTTLTTTLDDKYKKVTNMSIKDTAAKISGTFNDDYSPISGGVNNTFWYKIDEAFSWESVTMPASESKSFVWEVPVTNLDDGVHNISIRVQDSLGNGSNGSSVGTGGNESDLAFLIDKSVPKFGKIEVPSDPLNKEFTVSGIITDTYKVNKLSVKLGNDEIAVFEDGKSSLFPVVNGITYGTDIKVTATPGKGKSFDFTVKIKPVSTKANPNGIEDGPVMLTFTATGSSGQAAMEVGSFKYDTTGPSISIGAPLSSSIYVSNAEWTPLNKAVDDDNFAGVTPALNSIYDKVFSARIKDSGASFTVTFSDDYSPVFASGKNTKYWYKIDDGSWADAAIPLTEYGKQSVSVKLPIPGGKWSDGVHLVSIRVTDSLGNGYDNTTLDYIISGLGGDKVNSDSGHQTNLIFMIDSGIPALSGIKTDYGTQNSTFNISGTIKGTFEVQNMSVKILETVIPIPPASIVRASNTKKTYSFENIAIAPSAFAPATDGSQDGTYTVSVTVKGSSEQSVTQVSAFTLDTQGPKISFNSPIKEKNYLTDSQKTAIDNAISTNRISTLTSENSGLYYRLLTNNVKDATTGISGSFDDTYSEVGDTFWYSFNGGSWTAKPVSFTNLSNKKSTEWQIAIPGSLSDGLNRLSIRVKDTLTNGYGDTGAAPPVNRGGNGYESDLTFMLDRGAPEFTGAISGLKEDGDPSVKSSFFDVSGQIKGTFEIKRLSVSLGGHSGATVKTTTNGVQANETTEPYINLLNLTPVDNNAKTFNYSFRVYTVNGISPLDYGARSITINAVGSSDQSAMKTLQFIYDNKGPNITVNTPSQKVYMDNSVVGSLNTALNSGTALGALQTDYNKLTAMSIKDASAVLSGTFTDEYSSVGSSFWWSVNGNGWQSKTVSSPNDKSANWEIPLSSLALEDGIHNLSIRVKDDLGNGYDNGSPNPSGNGGQGYETNLAFMIDKSVPKIENISVPSNPLKTQFDVSGTITGTYGVKKLSVKLGNDEIVIFEEGKSSNYPTVGLITYGSNFILTPSGGGVGKSFNFTARIDPVSKKTDINGLQDGASQLTFTATGSSGQAVMEMSSFRLDTTGPSISIGAPLSDSIYVSDSEWAPLKTAVDTDVFTSVPTPPGSTYDKAFIARIKDSGASFTVTFTDEYSPVFASSKDKYWYRFDGDTSWTYATVAPTEYGKQSVSVKLPLPSGGKWLDGVHRLSIRAMDILDNGFDNNNGNTAPPTISGEGFTSNLLFMIDSGIPLLSDINTGNGIYKSSQDLIISGGKITNTFDVTGISVKIGSIEVANLDDITVSNPTNSKRTHNFGDITIDSSKVAAATSGAEGSYTVSVTVKGSSEQSAMQVSTFILDTKGPTISFNSPIKDKIYLSNSQLGDINTAITANTISSLASKPYGASNLKDTYYKLLTNNVKDASSGISGSFSDTYSNIGANYWYRFNGDAVWTEKTVTTTGKNAEWQIPLPGSLSDGLNRLSIRVKDALDNGYGVTQADDNALAGLNSGSGYETDITFILDQGVPVFGALKLNNNDEGLEPSVINEEFTVSGTITGTFEIKRLSISLGGPGATVILRTDGVQAPIQNGDNYIDNLILTPAGGKIFNYSFKAKTIHNSASLAYGSRSITITAVGSSDQSERKTLSFIFDNKGPNIAVNTPGKKVPMTDTFITGLNTALNTGITLNETQMNAYESLISMSIKDASATLSGTFTDDYSPIGSSFWWRIDGGAWQSEAVTSSNDKSANWDIPISALADGAHNLSIRVQDSLNNGSDYSSAGNGGHETDLGFLIDKSVPKIANISVPDNPLNTQFDVSGTITGTYGVKKLSVKLGSIEIAVIENALTDDQIITYPAVGGITYGSAFNIKPTSGIGKSFDFSAKINPVPIKTDSSGLQDGAATLTFTATGSSGQAVMEVGSFKYDTTGPSISIGAPLSSSIYVSTAEWTPLKAAVDSDNFTGVTPALNSIYDKAFNARIKDSGASFTVTFSDDYSHIFASGKDKYWYRIDNGSWAEAAVPPAEYGKQSVSVKLPPSKWSDGVHLLSIRATDILDNGYNNTTSDSVISGLGGDKVNSDSGHQTNLFFMIDSGIPVLSAIADMGIINTSKSLIISGGTITNTFDVAEMSVKIGSTEVANLDDITVSNSTNKKQTHSFSGLVIDKDTVSSATGDEEGSYTVSITVKGSSEQSAMQVGTFILDTNGPAISFNSPIKDKIYLNTEQFDDINGAITLNNFSLPLSGDLKITYYKLLTNNVKDASAGLSGSFADTYSNINKYWYSFNGGAWTEKTVTTAGKNAEWQIPLSGLAEGLNRLSIRVIDTLGNGYNSGGTPSGNGGGGYETNIAFILDQSAPLFGILTLDGTNEGSEPAVMGKDFAVKGQITETFEIKRISVSLGGPGTTVILRTDGELTYSNPGDNYIGGLTIKPVNGERRTFDLSFTAKTINGTSPLAYGSRSITITAVGSSDQTATKILPFIFDNQGPIITVNAPIKDINRVYLSDLDWNAIKSGGALSVDVQNKYNNIANMSIKDASAGLNGYFNDEYSAIGGKFWYNFPDDASSVWKETVIANVNNDKSFAWNIPLTDPSDSSKMRKDGIYRLNIRVKDALGNGYDSDTPSNNSGGGYINNLAIMIDMSVPVFSNVKLIKDKKELPETNIFLNGDFTITGTINETVSIAKLSAKIGSREIALAGTEVLPTPGIKITSNAAEKTHQFEIQVSPSTLGLEPISHSLSITATGSSGQSSLEVRNFTYDITAPGVDFSAPATGSLKASGNLTNNGKYKIIWSGSWVTGTVKITGTSDDSSGIEKIYYHLGKLNDDIAADDSAREALYTENNPGDIWTDTKLDSSSPLTGWTGGLYYWNYTEALNNYQFNATAIEKGGTDLPPLIPGGRTQFYLPFYVKVIDRAGNISIAQYKLYIDPDMDIPQAVISTPGENAMVGGAMRLSGTANDNNWVHSVEIRITDISTGNYYKGPEDEWAYPNEFKPGAVDAKDLGWVKAKIQGQTDIVVAWYHIINLDDKLTPLPADPLPKEVKIEIRALDTKDVYHVTPDLTGDAVERTIFFNKGVPKLNTPVITKTGVVDRDFNDGIRVSGKFTMTTTVEDDSKISSLRVRMTGSSSFTEVIKDDAIVLSALADCTIEKQAQGKFKLSFVIDTLNAAKYLSLGAGKTGNFTLELQVYDDNDPTPYNTNGIYSMSVDNYYPSMAIETQYNAATANFSVIGTAKDYGSGSGTVQGTEKLLVYFEKDGKYYNSRNIAAPADPYSGTGGADTFYSMVPGNSNGRNKWSVIPAMKKYPVRDMTGKLAGADPNTAGVYDENFGPFPHLELIPRDGGRDSVWESPHAMVIDGQELGNDSDSDGDGTFAEQWEGRVDVMWKARLDTTKFGDGPIIVHYVVMDMAGNATHYQEEIYIGNHRPLIRSINLGTDINGNGSITSWNNETNYGEYLANPITIGETTAGNAEIRTGFRVRNSHFGMRLDALFGNGAKNYRVSYVTRNAETVLSTAMVRGNVYTIASQGNTDWTKYGALNNNTGTTFVASGPARAVNDKGDPTTGSVHAYTYPAGNTQKTGAFGGNSYFTEDGPVDYVVIPDFTDFTGSMADTAVGSGDNDKKYDANGNMVLLHDKRFIVKVYDSTVSPGLESVQLAHVALLNVDFDNTDGQPPIIKINPFHWKSLTDNSIYDSAGAKKFEDLKGHIELEEDVAGIGYTAGLPKVSGIISIRGTVSDNNVIGSLWANMQGLNLTGTVAPENVGGISYYRIASYDTTNGLAGQQDQWANGWKCEILDQVIDQDGHRVSYRLDIDTSRHTSVVALNQAFRIIARDNKPNTTTVSASQTTETNKTSLYNMDIVPYISKITTRLTAAYNPNPSAFSRSAQGWYPVNETETITITGFNFNGNTGSTVKLNGTTLNVTATASKTELAATIGAAASGNLVVTVGSVDSVNNANKNTAAYNKEGNGLNNDTLTDDRYLYVWNTGFLHREAVISEISNPFMRMAHDGTRLLSYGYFKTDGQSSGRLRVIKDNTLYTVGGAQSNMMLNTTVGIGNSNTTYQNSQYNLSWYAAGSDMSSANNRGFMFGRNRSNGTADSNTGTENNFLGNPPRIGLASLSPSDTKRFKIPRIAVQPTNGTANRTDNNADRVLMGYFDDNAKALKIIYSSAGLDGNIANMTGITDTTNMTGSNYNTPSAEIVADSTTTHKGSMYTAVGFLKNGLPVVTWYDNENQNLILSWGNGTPTSTRYDNAGAVVHTQTTSASLTGTTYMLANHGYTVGSTVRIGASFPAATQYYVTGVSGNYFTLNTTVGGPGLNLGANINLINSSSMQPTGNGGTNTESSGNAATYRYTFGTEMTNGTVVYISINNATPIAWYVRSGSANTPSTKKFSTTAATTTAGDFLGNYNANELMVYYNITTVTAAQLAAPSVSSSWQGNAVIIDSFKGTHVDMAIDGNNNIHLAYYDVANGGLWYALITATGTGNGADIRPSPTNVTPVRVDTYLSAGTKIMINVRQQGANYVPYISYAHVSFSETRNSVRVAWRTNFNNPAVAPAGSNASDAFTGDWEVMTVPISSNVIPNTDEFICNGVPAARTGWVAAPTDSTLNENAGGIHKSILLGYMTDKWYEGAILKKDIW